MRYLFIVFLFLAYASTGQVIRTAGIALGTTVPTHTPTAQGALKYYNYSSGTTYKWYNSAWVVEATGPGSDDQNLDTFDIVANTLRISVEDDGVPFYSVDLSPYLDDTDTQLSEEQVEDYVGGMTVGNTVSLITVTYQDGDGTIDFVVEPNLSNYTNDAGFLTSEVDGSVSNELQTVDTFSLSGTVLSITLSGDGEAPYTVDLVSLQDGTGTDDQVIDTFDIVANTLRISLEDDGVPAETVDLSPYLDNTDTQDLSIDSAGNWYTVSLVNGGSVNIAKDTDTQLSEEQVEDFVGGMLSGNTETLISVDYQDADGTIDFVVEDDLSLYDNTTSGFISAEVDGSTTNEIQTIDTFAIVSNVLRASLLNDAEPFKSVDLSPYLDDTDTDDQGLTIGGSGPTYTIDIDGGADVTIAASGITTLSEGTANVLTFTTTEVDGSTTNEIQDLSLTGNTLALTSDASTVDLSGYLDNTDDQGLTVTGSGPDYIINQEDGTDITVSAAGIATLSEPSANELRITATEVDGSTTNEIQDFSVTDDGTTFDFDLSGTASDFALVEGTGITLSRTGNDVTIESTGGADDQGLTITGSGPTYVVDIEDGTDVTIEAAGINTLSEGTANVLTITGTEVDGSVTNEIQDITLSGTTTVTFDLSDDATDATITGAGIAAISRSGNAITVTATEADGSTTNEIQNLDTFTIVSNVLRASLLNDGIPFSSVDLSPYLDDTDTDNQIVDTFTIASNVLRLSLQDDAVPFEDVDLSPYLDNTDAQTLSFSNPNLSISGGNSVNISGIDTDTDDQGLTIGGSGPTYTVDIDGGTDVTIAAGGINVLSEGTANILTITATEVDGSTTNELQTIDTFTIVSNVLRASLLNDGVPFEDVDLSPYLDNTDAQTFSGSDDGTTFTLDLSGAATDIAFKEGSNVTITRTGTELTFASTGSADNWGTDVVNKNGTLTGDGTVASVLKVDTTVVSTKDFVYKGKVTQESSETIKTSNFTAVKTVIHPVDCSAGAITVTPPSSPAIGDRFAIVDSEAQAATNNITIDFTTGSYKLYTAVQNYIINVAGGYVEFIYMGSTTGWIATKG